MEADKIVQLEAGLRKRDDIIRQLTEQLKNATETTPYSYVAETQELAAQVQGLQNQLRQASHMVQTQQDMQKASLDNLLGAKQEITTLKATIIQKDTLLFELGEKLNAISQEYSSLKVSLEVAKKSEKESAEVMQKLMQDMEEKRKHSTEHLHNGHTGQEVVPVGYISVEELENQLEMQRSKLEEIHGHHLSEMKEALTQHHQEEISALEAHVRDVKLQLEAISQEHLVEKSPDPELEALHEKLARYQEENDSLKALESQMQHLQGESMGLQSENSELQSKLDSQNDLISTCEERLQFLSNEIAQFQENNVQLTNENCFLKEELETIRGDLVAKETELQTVCSEKECCKRDLDNSHLQMKDLRETITKYSDSLQELKSQLTSVTEENEQLERNLDSLEREKDSLADSLEKLNNEKNTLLSNVSSLSALNSELSNQLQGSLSGQESSEQALETMVDQLRTENRNVKAELQELCRENTELKQRTSQLQQQEKENAKNMSEKEHLQGLVEELSKQIEACLAENVSLKDTVHSLEGDLSSLKHSLKELEESNKHLAPAGNTREEQTDGPGADSEPLYELEDMILPGAYLVVESELSPVEVGSKGHSAGSPTDLILSQVQSESCDKDSRDVGSLDRQILHVNQEALAKSDLCKKGEDQSRGDKQGEDQSRGDKHGEDQSRGDKHGEDQSRGNKHGEDPSRGDKHGEDPSRGDKHGEDPSRGDKHGEDPSRGDKHGEDPSRGDKHGEDQSRGNKHGEDPSRGDKHGEDPSRGDKHGEDPSRGDKHGEDPSRGDKHGEDPSRGDKHGEDPSRGDKHGEDPSRGDKQREAGKAVDWEHSRLLSQHSLDSIENESFSTDSIEQPNLESTLIDEKTNEDFLQSTLGAPSLQHNSLATFPKKRGDLPKGRVTDADYNLSLETEVEEQRLEIERLRNKIKNLQEGFSTSAIEESSIGEVISVLQSSGGVYCPPHSRISRGQGQVTVSGISGEGSEYFTDAERTVSDENVSEYYSIQESCSDEYSSTYTPLVDDSFEKEKIKQMEIIINELRSEMQQKDQEMIEMTTKMADSTTKSQQKERELKMKRKAVELKENKLKMREDDLNLRENSLKCQEIEINMQSQELRVLEKELKDKALALERGPRGPAGDSGWGHDEGEEKQVSGPRHTLEGRPLNPTSVLGSEGQKESRNEGEDETGTGTDKGVTMVDAKMFYKSQETIGELLNINAVLESQVNKMEEKITEYDQLQESISELGKDRDEMLMTIAVQREELETMHDQCTGLMQKLESLSINYEEQNLLLRNAQNREQEYLDKCQSLAEELRNVSMEAEQQRMVMNLEKETELSTHQQTLREKVTQLHDMELWFEQSLKDKDEKAAKKARLVQKLEEELQALRSQQTDQACKILELQEGNDDLRMQLRASLDERQENISETDEIVRDFQMKIDVLEKEKAKVGEKLQQVLSLGRETPAEFQQRHQDGNWELVALADYVVAMTEHLSSKHKSLSQVETVQNQTQVRQTDLKKMAEENEVKESGPQSGSASSAGSDGEQFIEQTDELSQEQHQVHQHLADIEVQNACLRDELSKMKVEKENIQKSHADLVNQQLGEISEFQHSNDRAAADLQNFRSELAKLAEAKTDVEKDNKRLAGDIEILQIEKRTLNEELATKTKINDDLAAEFQKIANEKEDAIKHNLEISGERNQLQQDIVTLKEKIGSIQTEKEMNAAHYQEESTKLRNTVQSLEESLEQTQQELQDLQAKCQLDKEEISHLQENVQNVRSKNVIFEERFSEIQNENEHLQSEVSNITEDLLNEKEKVKSLMEDITEGCRKSEGLEQELSSLTQELSSTSVALKSSQESLHTEMENSQILMQEKDRLVTDCESLSQEVKLLEEEVENKGGELFTVLGEMEAVQKTVEEQNKSLKDKSGEIEALESNVCRLEQKISDISEQKNKLGSEVTSLQENLSDMTQKHQDVLHDNNNLHQQLESVREECAQTTAMNKRLDPELKSRDEEIVSHKKEREELLKKYVAATDSLEDLNKEKGALALEIKELISSLERETARVSELEQGETTLRNQIDVLNQENNALQVKVSSIEQTLLETETNGKELVARMQGEKNLLEQEIKDLRNSRDSLMEGKENIESNLNLLTAELTSVQEESVKTKQDLDLLKVQASENLTSADRFEAQVGELKKEVDALVQEKYDLVTLIDTLENKLLEDIDAPDGPTEADDVENSGDSFIKSEKTILERIQKLSQIVDDRKSKQWQILVEHKANQQSLNFLEKSKELLEIQLRELRDRNSSLERELGESKNHSETLSEKLEAVMNAMKLVKTEHETMGGLLEVMKTGHDQQVSELESQLECYKKENESLLERNANLEASCQATERNLTLLMEEKENLLCTHETQISDINIEHDASINDLRRDLSCCQEEKDHLRKSLDETQAMLSESVQKMTASQAEHVDMVKSHEQTLQEVNTELQAKLEQMTGERQHYEAEINKLTAANQAMQDQYVVAKQQVSDLQEERDNLAKSHQAELEGLRQRLSDKETELEMLKQTNMGLTEQYEKAYNQLSDLQEEKAQLTNQLSETKEEKEHLTNQLSEIQEEKAQLTNQLSETKEEKEHLTNQLSETKEKKEHLTNQLSETKEEIEQLTNQLSETKEEKEHLTNQLSEIQEEKAQLTNQLSEIQEEKAQLTNQWSDIQKEKEHLINQFAEIKGEKEGLTIQLSDIQKEKEQLTNQLSEIQEEKEQLTNQLSEIQKEKEQLTNQLSEIQEEKAQLTNQLSEIQEENAQLTNQLSEIQKEKEDLTNQQSEIQEEKEHLTNQMSEIQEEKERLTNQLSGLQKEKERLTDSHIEALDDNKHKLTAEIDQLKVEASDYKEQVDQLLEVIKSTEQMNNENGMKLNAVLKERESLISSHRHALSEVTRELSAEIAVLKSQAVDSKSQLDLLTDARDKMAAMQQESQRKLAEVTEERDQLRQSQQRLLSDRKELQEKFEIMQSLMESTKKECTQEIERLQTSLETDVNSLLAALRSLEDELNSTKEAKDELMKQLLYAEEERENRENQAASGKGGGKQEKDKQNLKMASDTGRKSVGIQAGTKYGLDASVAELIIDYQNTVKNLTAELKTVREDNASLRSSHEEEVKKMKEEFHVVLNRAESGVDADTQTEPSGETAQTSVTDTEITNQIAAAVRQREYDLEEKFAIALRRKEAEMQEEKKSQMEKVKTECQSYYSCKFEALKAERDHQFLQNMQRVMRDCELRIKTEVEKQRSQRSQSHTEGGASPPGTSAAEDDGMKEAMEQLHRENAELAEARDALLQEVGLTRQQQEVAQEELQFYESDNSGDEVFVPEDGTTDDPGAYGLRSESLMLDWELKPHSSFDTGDNLDFVEHFVSNCSRPQCRLIKEKYQKLYDFVINSDLLVGEEEEEEEEEEGKFYTNSSDDDREAEDQPHSGYHGNRSPREAMVAVATQCHGNFVEEDMLERVMSSPVPHTGRTSTKNVSHGCHGDNKDLILQEHNRKLSHDKGERTFGHMSGDVFSHNEGCHGFVPETHTSGDLDSSEASTQKGKEETSQQAVGAVLDSMCNFVAIGNVDSPEVVPENIVFMSEASSQTSSKPGFQPELEQDLHVSSPKPRIKLTLEGFHHDNNEDDVEGDNSSCPASSSTEHLSSGTGFKPETEDAAHDAVTPVTELESAFVRQALRNAAESMAKTHLYLHAPRRASTGNRDKMGAETLGTGDEKDGERSVLDGNEGACALDDNVPTTAEGPGGDAMVTCETQKGPGGHAMVTCETQKGPGGHAMVTCETQKGPGGHAMVTCETQKGPGGHAMVTCETQKGPGGHAMVTCATQTWEEERTRYERQIGQLKESLSQEVFYRQHLENELYAVKDQVLERRCNKLASLSPQSTVVYQPPSVSPQTVSTAVNEDRHLVMEDILQATDIGDKQMCVSLRSSNSISPSGEKEDLWKTNEILQLENIRLKQRLEMIQNSSSLKVGNDDTEDDNKLDLNAQVDDLENQIKDLLLQKTFLQDKCKELEMFLKSDPRCVDKNAIYAELKRLREQLSLLTSMNRELEENVEVMRDREQTLLDENHELLVEAQKHKDTVHELREENAQLQENFEEVEEILAQRNVNMDKMEGHLRHLEGQVCEVTAAKEEIHLKYTEMLGKAAKLNAQLGSTDLCNVTSHQEKMHKVEELEGLVVRKDKHIWQLESELENISNCGLNESQVSFNQSLKEKDAYIRTLEEHFLRQGPIALSTPLKQKGENQGPHKRSPHEQEVSSKEDASPLQGRAESYGSAEGSSSYLNLEDLTSPDSAHCTRATNAGGTPGNRTPRSVSRVHAWKKAIPKHFYSEAFLSPASSSHGSLSSSLDFAEKIRSGLGPEEDGHVALEKKHFELIDEISLLRRDLRETKAIYTKENDLLRDALEKSKAKPVTVEYSPIDIEDLKRQLSVMEENNKSLREENNQWLQRLQEQEIIVSNLSNSFNQSADTSLSEAEVIYGQQISLLQKQRNELMEKLRSQEQENQSLSKQLGEKCVLAETLRREREELQAKLSEKEDLEQELLDHKMRLERQKHTQEQLEELLYHQSQTEKELMRQKRILEAELSEIEAKLQEKEELLADQKSKLLSELRTHKQSDKPHCGVHFRGDDGDVETASTTSTLETQDLDDDVSVASASSEHFSEREIGRMKVSLREAEQKHAQAMQQLRSKLEQEQAKKDRKRRERERTGARSMSAQHQNQVYKDH